MSRAVVELVGEGVAELRFESLGRHRIRDIAGWTELFQLRGPCLRSTFPPLVTLDTGLPPIGTIVMLDAVGIDEATTGSSREDTRRLLGDLVDLFAASFSASDGQYLKLTGDGCLALFADPDSAVAFARSARAEARTLGFPLRTVIHVGRVEFLRDEPVGRALFVASALCHRAPPDRITLSRTAAVLIDDADDFAAVD